MGSGSVRLRTTVGAVVVVALALGIGAVVLVGLQREALRDGVEASAEDRASALVDRIEAEGLPPSLGADDEGDDDRDEDEDDDVVVQVTDGSGAVVLGADRLPDDGYLRVTEDAEVGETEYVIGVAASLEDVEDSTAALVPLLLVGVPLLLLVVGGTTWAVVTRALSPVERIRREVEAIGDERLDRRVPVPRARDEIHRLATTMNAMLSRLETSRDRQQRFVSDSSHELRSPLASLRQSAEVVRAHPEAMPDGELAEVVFEESVRMQRLVDQMLLLTRTDEGALGGQRREVDLDDLARTEAARARNGLVVDTSQVGDGRVLGDELALGQVVRNLLDNAARHARGRVEVAVRRAGTRVVLTVDDDGAGVPEDQRERVFERFVRLDEARARDDGGSGLGLAIVRELTRAHGGEAAVTTSPLGGARFTVDLPAS